MKEKNLISSKDFGKLIADKTDLEYMKLRESYDDFLEQILELWMFVPCGEDGEPLEYPDEKSFYQVKDSTQSWGDFLSKEYHKAKERCLFEGCFYDEEMGVTRCINTGDDLFYHGEPIESIVEDLLGCHLTLTETALKQIGL